MNKQNFNSENSEVLFQPKFKQMEMVDFQTLMSNFNKEVPENCLSVELTVEEYKNTQLFIKTMARSSTFAHKAHKELRDLVKK